MNVDVGQREYRTSEIEKTIMKDLSTTYLGLKLKNPVIVGSCGLTNSVEKIQEFADNNAGAVVLKSLFEEQIEAELASNMASYQSDYPDAYDYIRNYTRGNAVDDYLTLIAEAKKAVDIPIIASVNCISGSEWVSFAESVQKAGADALELNVSLLPSNPQKRSEETEQLYFDIVKKVSDRISIPIALKMSRYSAGLANLVTRLAWSTDHKIAGFVLFNRYYRPDINIDSMTMSTAEIFSTPAEITESLRWIGLLSGAVKKDFAASTGVHDSEAVIKQLLAGAAAVQVVSALYQNGPHRISEILAGIEKWMEEKSFTALADFRGKLSYSNAENPAAYERIQFMKQFAGIS
ncbi:dihydroorotate dehydrogenase-like protein [Desulfopila aestuarii]|uniref:Dihydroorotate dehydrogenase (Fumarate) n=1 Tax=Desulfopila aestuarii DSM 18488 TaxID=1121416 RepID=A0A1M7Y6I8_9BACT|nr:dihydroorotate dehydrogenase-like protein [Desulfopila aestuarii]SHO48249.1 dihydroorotate dehydrogenase (fumarate) [Desulfopila aestuarii DSM 18488]